MFEPMTRERLEMIFETFKRDAIMVGMARADWDKTIDKVKALAIEALEMRLRPISEAPKDGIWLFGHWPNSGRWSWIITRWFESATHDAGGYWEDQDGCEAAISPTHFIPLSSLPKVTHE